MPEKRLTSFLCKKFVEKKLQNKERKKIAYFSKEWTIAFLIKLPKTKIKSNIPEQQHIRKASIWRKMFFGWDSNQMPTPGQLFPSIIEHTNTKQTSPEEIKSSFNNFRGKNPKKKKRRFLTKSQIAARWVAGWMKKKLSIDVALSNVMHTTLVWHEFKINMLYLLEFRWNP